MTFGSLRNDSKDNFSQNIRIRSLEVIAIQKEIDDLTQKDEI